jgi:outer membrane protein assembly factor BamE
MRISSGVGIILALLAIAGCIRPYQLEVRQGNVVTQEMIDKLRPGMTKSQVRFVLGTPLVADPFHPERWDYISVYKKTVTAPAQTHQFTVIFDGDTLSRTEGDLAKAPTAAPGEPRGNVTGDEKDGLDGSPSSRTTRSL